MAFWEQLVLAEEAARIQRQQVPQQVAPPLPVAAQARPKQATQEENANNRYRTQIAYDTNNNPIYIGEAKSGSTSNMKEWRIKRLTYDVNGNVIDIRWANGDQCFDKKWSKYANYNYS